jgi:tetratricopeptide (TPR) repeat protein
MKKICVIICLSILTVLPAAACLNIYYSIDAEGHLHEATDMHTYFKNFNKNFNKKLICSKLPKLEKKIRENGDYKDLSDYAVYLMKLGLFEESKDILVALYYAHPDEYQLAANLGTAYELVGEVDSAMKYINRGMELNDDAHDGSEWVHIKVLETKKKLENDSLWLDNNTVLGLSDSQVKDTLVLHQIFIQAHERFPFTPGTDPIMASIMTDLGRCFAQTTSIEHAKAILTIARDYYGDTSAYAGGLIKDMIALRGEFKDIEPDQGDYQMGSVEKIDGIRYNKLMDNNDDPPYQVDLEQYETNVDTLLSLVDLAQIDRTVPADSALIETNASTSESGDEEKEDGSYMWIIVISCTTPVLAVVFFSMKRKK